MVVRPLQKLVFIITSDDLLKSMHFVNSNLTTDSKTNQICRQNRSTTHYSSFSLAYQTLTTKTLRSDMCKNVNFYERKCRSETVPLIMKVVSSSFYESIILMITFPLFENKTYILVSCNSLPFRIQCNTVLSFVKFCLNRYNCTHVLFSFTT